MVKLIFSMMQKHRIKGFPTLSAVWDRGRPFSEPASLLQDRGSIILLDEKNYSFVPQVQKARKLLNN